MSGAPTTADSYRRLGKAARLAHEAVTTAFRDGLRERSPDLYAALLKSFFAATNAALPSARDGFVDGLARGRVHSIEAAIAFLEADPWFFRSGYEKQLLIKHLKRLPLDEEQKQRLGTIVLAAIDFRDRQEFRHFCRLAIAVWSGALLAAVIERLACPDPGVRRRAGWVLGAADHRSYRRHLEQS